MSTPIFLSALGLLFLLPASAKAEIVELEISELIGEFTVQQYSSVVVELDFGRGFVSVDGAWLEIEATVTPWRWQDCGAPSAPEPCVPRTTYLGFLAIFDEPRCCVFTTVDGFSECPYRDRSSFGAAEDYEFLRDGYTEMSFGWDSLLFFDKLYEVDAEPTAIITDARLILDAEPVPEPSSAALASVALGSLVVICRATAFRR